MASGSRISGFAGLESDLDSRKGLETPSTLCDETDADFQMRSPLASPASRSSQDRQSPAKRGLSDCEFMKATREPFRFPSIPQFSRAGTPMCVICQGQLHGGELCRELRACGHCFHSGCIESHLGTHSRCPVCRVRCRPPSKVKKEPPAPRPFWTPDYDAQLMSISDRFDRERRQKLYLVKGRRDFVPQSYVFIKSSLPILLEESAEVLATDDGSLVSLSRFLAREREWRKLSCMASWTAEMRRVAVRFALQVIQMYVDLQNSVRHHTETFSH